MYRYLLIFLILSAACFHLHAQKDTLSIDTKTDASDSVEYELIVMDIGYESFLLSQAPTEYYTQAYYELWNSRYVMEWNYRHMDPLRYGDSYEVQIDYRDEIDYGLELNYRLYYYFKFFEKENAVDLWPGK